jgi:hypothetical protein
MKENKQILKKQCKNERMKNTEKRVEDFGYGGKI